MTELFVMRSFHEGHPEQGRFDRIEIDTYPRWKESQLSGDEWRFSVAIRFFVKGVEIHSQTFRDIETAIKCLPALHMGIGLTNEDEMWKRREEALRGKCDNPGCCRPAQFIHHLKARYTNSGHKYPVSTGGSHRRFCEMHKHRGDCALEDADSNYEVEPIDGLAGRP
jgi:hypothetical protein